MDEAESRALALAQYRAAGGRRDDLEPWPNDVRPGRQVQRHSSPDLSPQRMVALMSWVHWARADVGIYEQSAALATADAVHAPWYSRRARYARQDRNYYRSMAHAAQIRAWRVQDTAYAYAAGLW